MSISMQAESFASGGNLATDASFGTATRMMFDAHSSVGV
jgi:hypothetical protein